MKEIWKSKKSFLKDRRYTGDSIAVKLKSLEETENCIMQETVETMQEQGP